ncbi:hypothetical protein [Burkholderia cenocepacia]|uniref:hypothetical protein n=1 Tax=Burkholderia cenocepacia TaxID=95486 RepID=UPI002651B6F1|nr:hypothetical protein [Burkholderia cenocepacia]MDN7629720.1 hypothetical protein [Burkholderia cenocepacia]
MARTPEEAFKHTAEVAKAAGLTLLTTEWAGAKANYLFRCRHGHEFERRAIVITRGSTRCEQCFREEMRQRFLDLLAERDLICLEGGYQGQTIRQHFQCGQGHRWSTEARKILEGSGCPVCAHEQSAAMQIDANGLERLRQAAAEHGGRCLADVYLGIADRYEWECASGHRWLASGQSIVRGNWCRVCFGRRHSERMLDPNGLARLKETAVSHGGQCLAGHYVGVNEKYEFRCAEGHEWQAMGSSILMGAWCDRCARKRVAEARRSEDRWRRLKAVAASYGGDVVEHEYAGISARYTFRCERGHQWRTRGTRVLEDGTWCRRCAGLRRRHTLETMQQVAHERGGRCLSSEYLGVKVPLSWECHRGHIWQASPDSILNGPSWCPNCALLEKTKKPHLRLKYDYEGNA